MRTGGVSGPPDRPVGVGQSHRPLLTAGPPIRSPQWQRRLLTAVLVLGVVTAAGLATRAGDDHHPGPAPPASTPASIRLAVVGDFGSTNSHEAAVAAMVVADDPDAVLTVGDNAYGSAGQDLAVGQYYHSFIGGYAGAYGAGSTTNRFFPALGNHDISDGPGLPGYLAFYDLPGAGTTSLRPSGNERYYDVVLGPVHVFFVNSDPSEPNGRTAASAQATWLRNGLAASPSPWNVVVFHHAAFSSSSSHGSNPTMQWPFEAWGADLVLNGHDHTYERIVRDDDSDGTPLTYVVDGLGGQSPYGFTTPVAGSQVRYHADYGALFLDATATTLTGTFATVGGATPDTFTLNAPAQGHITGQVTDAGGDPVVGAMVHAVDYRADPAVILGDVTDATGHYDIAVPAPDAYAVGVLDPTATNAFEYAQDNPSIDPADDAVVTPGQTVTVDVALDGAPAAPGGISGTVTDAGGPVPGAWVMSMTAGGTPTLASVTDASGHYTISGLAPGEYRLVVADPSGLRRWEYFDDATSWPSADTLTVAAGTAATADVVLAAAP